MIGLALALASAGLSQDAIYALADKRMTMACRAADAQSAENAETCACMQRQARAAHYPDLYAVVAEAMRERYRLGPDSRINRPARQTLRDDYGIFTEARVAPVWKSAAFAKLKSVCRPR